MLCLGRTENQYIQIGDDIEVWIVAMKGSQVTIGIQAPPEVNIRRGELDDEKPEQ